MAFREVSVTEIREVLRRWLGGAGLRTISRSLGMDRKAVRRYVEAAQSLGVLREGGVEQLDDGLLGGVSLLVVPGGRRERGRTWHLCEQHRAFLQDLVDGDLRLTKIQELLKRRSGVEVPYRTLHRYASGELSFRRVVPTVRVDDGEPGGELQVDFGRMGLLTDAATGKRRVVWALIFTACFSRHSYVYLSYRQGLEDVIRGFEAAWTFFGGIFAVVIPDNMKSVVNKVDPLKPLLNERFLEYSQARDFEIDTARVRKPKDKPRVERAVPYVRESFWEGEDFESLEQAQKQAVWWCLNTAGRRTHGTTRKQPVAVFEAEEKPLLKPAPSSVYELPLVVEVKVHPDHHVRVDHALYSMPTAYIGQQVRVHATTELVRIYHRNRLIKTHPRKPQGERSTHPEDYPPEKRIYAMRDLETLRRNAEAAGPNVGIYAQRLLDTDLPWTQMRHCYRLLGLVRRYGAGRVDTACGKALELDVVDVLRVDRMLQQALETGPPLPERPRGKVVHLRFARPASDFAVDKGGER